MYDASGVRLHAGRQAEVRGSLFPLAVSSGCWTVRAVLLEEMWRFVYTADHARRS